MDKVISSASHHAMLFAYLAKETIDCFGDEGRKAVTAGVIRYGKQRGHRMALRTLADGKPLNVENYLLYGEWEAFPGQMDLRFPDYSPEVHMQNYRCPWHTEWSSRGLLEYGRYYCRDVDAALARGYNDMELQLLANRALGDECCDFVFKNCGIPEERMDAFAEARVKLGGKAKMPWEYHIGHLYRTMREEIVAAFGKEGEDAVARAMDQYCAEYGTEARDKVLEFADVDYDIMPEYEGIGE
ncbi:MAG: L-2-amino-thiazoline-4-carboxylic acid hydrolase [Clostridiales bacterium]|nr:L-2-amino-thiazoline-4-carboxylic acid hydrolase [Clostridiales bacterium]